MNSYETLSEYYDRFTDDVGYEEWADFFERLFEREGVKPSLVLDLACGTGSLTRILAQRGYDMIGADASPEMLMQALQNTLKYTRISSARIAAWLVSLQIPTATRRQIAAAVGGDVLQQYLSLAREPVAGSNLRLGTVRRAETK